MRLVIFTEPQQGAGYDDLRRVAQLAEETGFDGFFRSDHYVAMGGDGLPGPTDAWLTLAALAVQTSTIRLGTLVTSATFRLPGPLAIGVAQVDAMSGGRVELGLGAGWFEREHEAYAIPFPPLGERFDRLEEQLEIIEGLWTTPVGATYSFTGKHYQVVDSPALPKLGPVAPPADHPGRFRQEAHPGPGGQIRGRVQRPVHQDRRPAQPATTGSARRARRSAAPDPRHSRPQPSSASAATTPRYAAAPPRSAATWTRCAATAAW
nr:hypothetical protein GCM10020092_019060 [Actinoplanes digitatis]